MSLSISIILLLFSFVPIATVTGEWSEWSECTAECGGGTRFRTRECAESAVECETLEREDCNTDDCNPEPQLQGTAVPLEQCIS